MAGILEWLTIACLFSGYSCEDVPIPEVKWVEVDQMPGSLGTFDRDTSLITMRKDQTLSGVRGQAVLIHEITHYLQWYWRPASMGDLRWHEYCFRESEAWGVYNDYVMYHNRLDLYRELWWKAYAGCQNRWHTEESKNAE